jgi:DNA-binding LacI/PurR family transcriptional regulator
LRVPHDVSVVCLCNDDSFQWISPAISHVACADRLMAARVVRWVDAEIKGRADRACVPIHAGFVEAGSIGPVSAFTSLQAAASGSTLPARSRH